MSRLTIVIAIVGSLTACGDSLSTSADGLSPSVGGANVLTITTSKTTYGWEEASFGGEGVIATIVNPNNRDYFANIGDAFNGATDQPNVFIALGTDAAIEKLETNGSWTTMGTGVLVEGSKVVVLRAGASYRLRGNLSDPRTTGTMRVRLRYYTSANTSGQTPLVDFSNAFTVR
jgi:hypothetical protein